MALRAVFRIPKRHSSSGWDKLVTAWTSKDFVDRMKAVESNFAAMRTEISSVSKQVEPIDWAYWRATLSNPAVVDKLKQEYESHKFKDLSVDSLRESFAFNENQIQVATRSAEFARLEAGRVDAVIQKAVERKEKAHTLTVDEFTALYPGLKEQLKNEFDNEEYFLTEEEERVGSVDPEEIRKQLKNGQQPQIPEVPSVGDLDTKAELNHARLGTWSVASWLAPKEEREKIHNETAKFLSGR